MILLTGAAGFIGFHLSDKLLKQGYQVIGVDNLNDYYDVNLKHKRLEQLKNHRHFSFVKLDIADNQAIQSLFEQNQIEVVINLAAQAGVRYSLINPHSYISSNIVGFTNILEACRHHQVKHLIYASSSSVYGANEKMPFSVQDGVNHPLSIYAASKRANEIMAHSYSSLFELPTTGLRFFTVYGPWGRPDMALFLFAKAIEEEKTIKIFNHGKHLRDFTYIDDIVHTISLMVEKPAQPNPKWNGKKPDPASSFAPFKLYNIGRNQPVELMRYIECLEKFFAKTVKKEFLPLQPGDVVGTYANVDSLIADFNYQPSISVEEGIEKFVHWYQSYYQSH